MQRPTGPVTFLATDIEGSTRLWEDAPETMRTDLARHDAILRAAIEGAGGAIFKTTGDGVLAAFRDPLAALTAAVAVQREVRREPWRTPGGLWVRVALHTGAAEERDGDYFGPPLNRVARLLAVGHGGQILLTQSMVSLLEGDLPAGLGLRDLGSHRLKDLTAAEQLYQVATPDLPAEFPPLRSLDILPNNLPVQVTSFVGREREREEVRRLLASTRLLTLTGVGGSGKTRLALQVAAESLDGYRDGVWLVELAALSDPGLVPQAAASVLRLREQPGRSLSTVLAEYLRSRQVLLILDNCEHLVDACAQLADTLLHACPDLRVLATSREPLGVGGELTYHVPPLSVPDPGRLPPAQALAQYEAVRLFVERASLVQPSFALTAANAAAVARICNRLDGIPLAIELAAARVKALSVEQIAARLDDRFRLLTGGPRTAYRRQQTLRAAMDWSYDLLSDAERALLRRLAVFAGGFDLEAVEAVCAGAPAGEDPLDLLTHLVDRSLVLAEPLHGGVRYRLLETVRQYGREKLDQAGQTAAAQRQHRDHFLTLAHRAHAARGESEVIAWQSRLEHEHDNVRAAIEWSLQQDDPVTALEMATALQVYWRAGGYLSEAREWVQRALESGQRLPVALRFQALMWLGEIMLIQEDYDRARRSFEHAQALTAGLADAGAAAGLHAILGHTIWHQGHHAEGAARCRQSVTMLPQVADPADAAFLLNHCALVAWHEEDYPQMRALAEQGLSSARTAGDPFGMAALLWLLGLAVQQLGEQSRAAELLRESLALSRRLDDRFQISRTQPHLADLLLDLGDVAQAEQLYRESLELMGTIGERWFAVQCLDGLAQIASDRAPERAARLLGAADALREAVGFPGTPRPHYDRALAVARAALGAEGFARAYAEGKRMPFDRAVEFSLESGPEVRA